ncbi:hypothetical protein [Candidatus Tisiphia endosymbiont of Thecophora atra]|uniref:hypothetical protein n=1 Tax=Candidatus Tisiphia endosymbiont of Thecophora atra TaxID=3066258 RepID=UPI00312C96BF
MMKINQIIPLIKNLEEDYTLLFHDVIGSFISEITDPDNFDENSAEVNLLELSSKLGENITNYMIYGATEFFLSNEYPHRITRIHWNCIDHLLKTQGDSFTDMDKKYLLGLRDSYMCIYKVADVYRGKNLTLTNMIESKHKPITIKGIDSNQDIEIGDIIGCRVVKVNQEYLLSSVCLVLTSKAASNAIKMIKQISKMALTKKSLKLYMKIYKDPELMFKKIWAKEIMEQWFLYAREPYTLN